MKKIIIIFITVLIIFGFGILILFSNKNKEVDFVEFGGKRYILLEYNMDIFTYYHNSNVFLEEDEICKIEHDKYDVVYFNGDLYIFDKQVSDATKYYSNDKNYDWYIVFDKDDNEIKKSISIEDSELEHLYNIENNKKKDTIVFDDIEMFSSIQKVSKDGLVQGTVTLARINNDWYYKTEIMTDDDREYVIKLEDSLNDKINDLYI